MPMCEKCYNDAFVRAYGSYRTQASAYRDLVQRRDEEGHPCLPRERAGQFWDEATQRDSREAQDAQD